MKPLSIADYLDHLGGAPAEKPPPRPEGSPFRPRSLPGAQSAELRPRPAFTLANPVGASETEAKDARGRTPWERKALPLAASAGPTGGQTVKPEDIAIRLAEAHARGREEGLAEGRAEARDRHAAELAAMRQEADSERLEFERSEYTRLEGAIRSGLKEIEGKIGATVARILAPFLERRLVECAVDELTKAIIRLSAAGQPRLMTIRGPERVLARLRERIADLPVEIAYVDDKGPEVLVEANATQITTALRPWAELLAPFAD